MGYMCTNMPHYHIMCPQHLLSGVLGKCLAIWGWSGKASWSTRARRCCSGRVRPKSGSEVWGPQPMRGTNWRTWLSQGNSPQRSKRFWTTLATPMEHGTQPRLWWLTSGSMSAETMPGVRWYLWAQPCSQCSNTCWWATGHCCGQSSRTWGRKWSSLRKASFVIACHAQLWCHSCASIPKCHSSRCAMEMAQCISWTHYALLVPNVGGVTSS